VVPGALQVVVADVGELRFAGFHGDVAVVVFFDAFEGDALEGGSTAGVVVPGAQFEPVAGYEAGDGERSRADGFGCPVGAAGAVFLVQDVGFSHEFPDGGGVFFFEGDGDFAVAGYFGGGDVAHDRSEAGYVPEPLDGEHDV